MAAVTVDSRRDFVINDRRAIQAQVDIATTGDTWATGLTNIDACYITPAVSGITTGATYSGGTITFAISGALTNVKVLVMGT